MIQILCFVQRSERSPILSRAFPVVLAAANHVTAVVGSNYHLYVSRADESYLTLIVMGTCRRPCKLIKLNWMLVTRTQTLASWLRVGKGHTVHGERTD